MTAPQRAAVSLGHWTDGQRRTGCSVILFDRQCSAVVDVRGGAPGTRETDLLASDRLVGRVDALLFTGGSAFGLGAAEGVMRFLHERGRGFPTDAFHVPIVPAAVIYDLTAGDLAWPTPDDGYLACESAVLLNQASVGAVGVGTAATYRKLWPDTPALPGGIGMSTTSLDSVSVTAISVVNAIGDVPGPNGADRRSEMLATVGPRDERTASTLVAVIIDGPCDDRTLRRVAISAHDGMARSIVPCHTLWDGDVVFAIRTGESIDSAVELTMRIAIAAELAVEESIRNAVA